MKKIIFTFLVCCTLILESPATAGTIKDAEGFIKAGQYPQAIAILEGITEKSPGTTNALAQYKLGVCYTMTQQLQQAEERYKAAMKLDPKFGLEIASVFKSAGHEALNKNHVADAQQLYFKAVEYQPSLRITTSDELYKEGENLIKSGLMGLEDNKFIVAGSLSNGTSEKICTLYTELGNNADDDNCLLSYIKCKNFCKGYNEKTGQRLIGIAQRLAKQVGREQQTKLYKDVASIFVGQQYVETQVPAVKKFITDIDIDFPLEEGEQTPYWIEMESGFLKFSHSEDSLYKIVFNNNNEYLMNEPLPGDIFFRKLKIVALKKSYVRFTFRKQK